MKHIVKHLKKIKKDTMKKGLTILVLLFFAMAMFFQKDAPTRGVDFVRNADEVFMYNAPNQQRDYLFVNESGQQTYQWTIGTWTPTTTTNWSSLDALINPNEVGQIIGELKTGNTTGIIQTGSLDCTTPRGEIVKNQDFILGYKQRKDVNTICDVQKRVCMSGTLWGTFIQDSCSEDVIYNYNKAPVISYNQKVLNEYIQPTDPVNAWAEFNTQGQVGPQEKATNTRGTTNSPVITKPGINETPLPIKKGCTTHRGQKIKHGQFIKAYKVTRGFKDLPCNVEIRACVNGTMKGTFTNAKCTYYDTTSTEYIKAGSPTSNAWFLFFQRIKSILY